MRQPPNQSVLLDIYLLTFQSNRGKILSKSVMRAWPAVPCFGVRGFPYLMPPALSSANAGGYSFAISREKIAGHSAPPVNSRKRPRGPAFSGG